MPRPRFKQKCAMCKEDWVIMYSARQFPICIKCHMKKIDKEVKDPAMKKLLDIPNDLYEKSLFLRKIKEAYLMWDKLSEKQIEAFKKAVKDIKEGKSKEEE
jgi:hypothetical protein